MEQMQKNRTIMKNIIENMGGKIIDLIPERGYFYLQFKNKTILIDKNISLTRQSFITTDLTRFKDITSKLLIANNLPTPNMECFYKKTYNKKTALKKLKKLHYPIIIKNSSGSNSIGIFPDINNPDEAIKILNKYIPKYSDMVAQEMVFGKEYRILVLNNKIIGALEMIHPHIIGDGISNVRELIQTLQLTTKKKTNFNKQLKLFLKKQSVSLTTIISKGKKIYFKSNSCLAEGGKTKDVTLIVNKEIENICVNASKVVGRYLVGIDVICQDITRKPTKKTFNILEINSRPDLYIHYNPTYGKSQNVVKKIINFIIK